MHHLNISVYGGGPQKRGSCSKTLKKNIPKSDEIAWLMREYPDRAELRIAG